MKDRFPTLDGWRGVAILCVLAGHLLPLGPKDWHMNGAIASTGMVIFFNLSGFLITSMFFRDTDIRQFLIRRCMRIVPLAWLVLCITLICSKTPLASFPPLILFYANWGNPMGLTPATGHFWSLCVEMQFYFGIAVLVLLLGKRGLYGIPFLAAAITLYRWHEGVGMAINTYYRVDEILAGGILALLFADKGVVFRLLSHVKPLFILPLVIVSAHQDGGLLQYFRPYFGMLLIASTLCSSSDSNPRFISLLGSKTLSYIATISFALYVLHGVLGHTWLGEGDTLMRYVKRPLLFAITFLLAHISTFYYELFWIQKGKEFSSHLKKNVIDSQF